MKWKEEKEVQGMASHKEASSRGECSGSALKAGGAATVPIGGSVRIVSETVDLAVGVQLIEPEPTTEMRSSEKG